MSTNVNYAKLFGYDSAAAAVVFAILYVPLVLRFLPLMLRQKTLIVRMITIFCVVRITSFILRAILIVSSTAGENESLFTAAEVLSSIGFVGLLSSTYGLVLDRLALSELEPPSSPIAQITRNRRAFHLATTLATVLGIVGITQATNSDASTQSTGNILRKISLILFLVLTLVQAYQTFVLVQTGSPSETKTYTSSSLEKFGAQHATYILAGITMFMLVREIFLVATIGSSGIQNKEHFWYPFVALPEVLCAALYAIPGLIPPREVMATIV